MLLKNKYLERLQDIHSDIMSFDHLPTVRTMIHDQLLASHQEWVKEPLLKSFIYGIRSYTKGATLTSHVDRIATHHISSIIIVDKDLACGCSNKPEAEDWPLDIQGHDGEWYKVYSGGVVAGCASLYATGGTGTNGEVTVIVSGCGDSRCSV